ncbi:MAG: DNA-directed RNA polymerase subunit alpha [Sulfurimonas sp.]|jgi:DNA-directed RNA polymerase subunit alpha|uniref:DNA-directed RNA polymerase subunit alpha n=1 Tax=unclassified Sulfurimonas TaxID=2623549 RepID=UPI0008BF81A2|nr:MULTISPECIES: DNA-directed RNA polymerase subunit alpha [unclassified Sulfurimonas]OHE11771.1 MAG: DNA-directed RNA polymerase subunit alpha [Sulfurimonas sp. RIFOXYC2_FULL_36_7]MBS4067029.1 DNA-directed RNA polymerase subunit alpha [Sulfurimonas sp.]MDD3854795.1 DNA-directed RNA polymerase subunit alpha [Sulfurimonas sp.]MDX9757295.1 DNA-directed RNA polymerase subunit alpha [Sulfurimonas sp.]OHE06413.1 MAG: DNA-directed RNA polymerase subunit alpha [Sulfurimonas sp. RIFOXYB12_FULL_35_9]
MKKIKTTPLAPQEFEVEQISENEANIMAYPFETGYAISLAHPLRRFLLSSSVGYAPIAIKIEGAKHEFDSVRGMLEDISDFILNLKEIRFKLLGKATETEINYSFTGPCTIKGSDLTNNEVEIVTPEAHLATLNEDSILSFSIKIAQGIGYVASEDTHDELEDGYIALDAYFTPVRSATYKIENVLVEDNPNFERVIINIRTDGQISPLDAFRNSLEVMYAQLAVFNSEISVKAPTTIERVEENPDLKKLTAHIDSLGLSARSFNCLDRSNIKLIGEIALMSINDLKNVKNLGKKSYDEIIEKLQEFGYEVGGHLADDVVSALKKKIEAL